MSILLSGRTNLVCKADSTVSSLRITQAQLAAYDTGILKFSQVRAGTSSFVFGGIERRIFVRSITSRFVSLIKKPPP